MTNRYFFRSRTSVASAWFGYVIIAIMVIQMFFTSDLHGCVTAMAWAIFAATIIYLILHRPSVELFDEGIRITNPIDQITVGWQRIDSIEAQYAMSIVVGNKVIYAWAAPAPGRYHGRTIHASELRGMSNGVDGLIRPGESPRTDSGAATYLARTRLNSFRESMRSDGLASAVTINKTGLALLIGSFGIGLLLNIYHF